MDVLRPSYGIRAIFNALLDGHRLHNDKQHRQWRKYLASDPTGQMRAHNLFINLPRNPRLRQRSYMGIYKRQYGERNAPCFQFSKTRGIYILPSIPNKDGFVWAVILRKAPLLELLNMVNFDTINNEYIVMKAMCADLDTAIKMRNDYIQFGYYPQTDQLRLANHRARLDESLCKSWGEEIDTMLKKNNLHNDPLFPYSLPQKYLDEWVLTVLNLHKKRERRLQKWLQLDRVHRPVPKPELVLATALSVYAL